MPLSGPRVSINLSTSGDHTVIAGVASEEIRIYKLILWAGSAVTVIFKDGSTAINGAGFSFGASQGFAYDGDTQPLVLGAGNDFVLNLNTNATVTGWAYYAISNESL